MEKLRTVILENTWCGFMPTGWGNGYVVIPEGHPLHGKHYDAINVYVHYGLTFSEYVGDIPKEAPLHRFLTDADKDSWIIGFDTAHYGDNIYKWPKEAVQAETDRLLEQVKNYKS